MPASSAPWRLLGTDVDRSQALRTAPSRGVTEGHWEVTSDHLLGFLWAVASCTASEACTYVPACKDSKISDRVPPKSQDTGLTSVSLLPVPFSSPSSQGLPVPGPPPPACGSFLPGPFVIYLFFSITWLRPRSLSCHLPACCSLSLSCPLGN